MYFELDMIMMTYGVMEMSFYFYIAYKYLFHDNIIVVHAASPFAVILHHPLMTVRT